MYLGIILDLASRVGEESSGNLDLFLDLLLPICYFLVPTLSFNLLPSKVINDSLKLNFNSGFCIKI